MQIAVLDSLKSSSEDMSDYVTLISYTVINSVGMRILTWMEEFMNFYYIIAHQT